MALETRRQPFHCLQPVAGGTECPVDLQTSVQNRARALENVLPTLGAVRPLRKLMGSWFASAARDYTEREQQLMAAEFVRGLVFDSLELGRAEVFRFGAGAV